MGEKVKVSREAAEGLRRLFACSKENYSNDEILRLHYQAKYRGERWRGDWWEYINELSLSEMAQALYVGYEVEETPEEKALAYYNSFDNTPLGETTEKMAIRKFLNIAEIKFKGIND